MANKIFFCGEVVVDMLEQQQGSGDFKLLLGGSHFNSAMGAVRAVKRENLDIQIGFIGPVSQDMFGGRFFKAMQDAGIDTSGVKRVPCNSTLAVVSVHPGKENDFCFYDSNTTVQITAIEDLPEPQKTGGDNHIFCFGSISTVLEPARFAWYEFTKRLRNKALIYYDLNARPSIARDPEKYRNLLLEWASVVHIMRASDADIAWAYPEMSTKEVADIWLKAGASLAVFTKGHKGSEAYTRKCSAVADALDLIASNTVGAGDNANAGLVIALAKMDCFTPRMIEELSETRLTDILQGANNTAALHLISIGARPREEAVG
ncbi:MAG: PfkB family carbohydrate kinase [Alphaproteobacteria bacterium]|nr:PfkB family carbohydrate kinase [Alphaproteobacteria bacterium]